MSHGQPQEDIPRVDIVDAGGREAWDYLGRPHWDAFLLHFSRKRKTPSTYTWMGMVGKEVERAIPLENLVDFIFSLALSLNHTYTKSLNVSHVIESIKN